MNGDFILKYIRTSEEKNELINLLEELLENTFKRDFEVKTDSKFISKAMKMIYAQIDTLNISNDREKTEEFLEIILESTRKLPEIRLALAINPTEELIDRLKNWAAENNLGNAIFHFELRPDIVAGALIMSEHGQYANYSLSSQIDKFFVTKKQELLSLI